MRCCWGRNIGGFRFSIFEKPIQAQRSNSDSVIPGWSQRVGALRRPMTGSGPDLRCAIAHRGISRFRVRCGACHRAALRADPLASPRNDGVCYNSKHDFPTPRRDAPESCIYLSPPGGRGECRVPVAPAASRALCSGRTHTSNNEYTGITRHSRTQWFYGLCRALPGDRALLPPSSRGYVLSKPGWADLNSADLTPASGCQDHTILPYAATSLVRSLGDRSRIHRTRPVIPSRARRCRVHRIPSRVRDDRDTPLLWDGMARICRDDLPDG